MKVDMFDSHLQVKKFCSVGFTEKQAEAQVNLQMAVLKGQLVTQDDIEFYMKDLCSVDFTKQQAECIIDQYLAILRHNEKV